MACCAMPGGCGRPDCYLCTVLPVLFPVQPKKHIDPPRGNEDTAPVRDGLFDYLTKSHDPTFEGRPRVGPHR